MKRIAIIQSCYIPWRGFFDLIARCDEYVIFDSVQFAKRHWHNRNKIKTSQGSIWLTIPVATKSKFEQPIDDVQISEAWAERHWQTIAANYKRAPYFVELGPHIESLYAQAARETHLTKINELLIGSIASLLNLKTRHVRDTHYSPAGAKTERLLDICLKADATHYLSGPSAKSYLEEEQFRQAGITVEWMDYPTYPPYGQVWGEYLPMLSMIDTLFNAGTDCEALWNTSRSLSSEALSSER